MSRPAIDASHRPTDGTPHAAALADEKAADAARAGYRAGVMKPVPADRRVASLLTAGERVVAVHRSVALDRRRPAVPAQPSPPLKGVLYVTSRRIILVGAPTVTIPLEAVDEAVLCGGSLRLILDDGCGVTVQLAEPRLLRVEIAAARAAARVPQTDSL